MLNSPIADTSETCTLFNAGDLAKLKSRDPKLIGKLAEAHQLILDYFTFLKAYARGLDTVKRQQLLAQFEVKAMMHCFDKKVDSRVSYNSLLHALDACYLNAKSVDSSIPEWPRLAPLREQKDKIGPNGGLRAIYRDGRVPDDIIKSKGFEVGVQITNQKDVYQIVSLMGNMTTVQVKQIVDDNVDAHAKGRKKKEKLEDQGELIEIARNELLSAYSVYIAPKLELITGIPAPSANKAFMNAIIEGQVKTAMLAEFYKAGNATQHVTIQKSPELAAVATKKFAVGSFKVVALTNNVMISETELEAPWFHMGNNVYIKGSNTAIKDAALKPKSSFLSTFYVIKSVETTDPRIANCEYNTIDIKINLGSEKVLLKLPIIVNTKAIKDEDHIVVVTEEVVEPPKKMAKAAKAMGVPKKNR